MSHRENSLTPWITNDPESYRVPDAIRKMIDALPEHAPDVTFGPHNPVYLPKSLYDRAAKLGYDMSGYAITRPMPSLRPVPDSMTRRGNPK